MPHQPEERGLSPLARGTPTVGSTTVASSRFIPAGAGNTPPAERLAILSAVYPRWRGEHCDNDLHSEIIPGLSPLARGTLCRSQCGGQFLRFIPAGAGNTPAITGHNFRIPVYPRWRGEHSRYQQTTTDNRGLSPLARGTHPPRRARRLPGRFIPAGAGNTLKIYYCFIIAF